MSDELSKRYLDGSRTFEFDLPPALLDQLVGILEGMEQGQLTPEHTIRVPNAQGVYQLFHAGKLVYIGKTDAQAGLAQRLTRHAWTIQSRRNLTVSDMSFKAVQVLVFSALDLETALIRAYKARQQYPAWNGSGFGANDPGRQRDRTALHQDGFDANYPINTDAPVDVKALRGGQTVLELLTFISQSVPYTLRHERTPDALEQLRAATVVIGNDTLSVREALLLVCMSLTPGWQATQLPGRVILYREHSNDYPGGIVMCRS